MIRFLASIVLTALALPVYLRWSAEQAEEQIDKMQEAAFNTPGAEAPVTPSIVMGGIGLLFGHFVVGRRLLRLRGWQAFLSLLAGVAGGVATFVWQTDRQI